jgi:predicted ester cyclase
MTIDPPSADRLSVNKTVARRLYEEVINRGRLDVLDDIVAEHGRDRAGGERWSAGREGFVQHITWLRQAVENAHVTVTELIAEGDRVVVYWRLEGVHRGELFGVPATGRPIDGDSISTVTVRDGRIVDYAVLPDRQQFIRQLTQ